MKKILLLVLAVAALMVFGCTKDDSPTNPGGGAVTPINVTLTATADGYGVIFGWSVVTNADSYEVEFPGTKGTVFVTTTSYTHNDPTELGSYRVRTMYQGATSNWSSTKSTAVYTGSGQIGDWTNSSIPSCYYWTTTGTGTSISRLDPNAATLSDIYCHHDSNNDLQVVSAQTAPLNGVRQSSIAYTTDPGYSYRALPSGGGYYLAYQEASMNGYFWVNNGDGRYVRLKITALNQWDYTFSWRYQPVQGFRYTY